MLTVQPHVHGVLRLVAVLTLSLVLGPARPAAAQPAPTSIYSLATLSSRVDPAAPIDVRTRSGDVMSGLFSEASDEWLRMTVSGRAQSLPAGDVLEVRRRGGRSTGNGALAGMGVGVALAVVGIATSGSKGGSDASVAPASIIGAAGGGAMWGAIIGTFVRQRPLVYQSATAAVRVAPVIAPRAVGLLASLRF